MKKFESVQGAPKTLVKYKDIKIEIDKLKFVFGDFNIPLSGVDKSSRQK